MKYKTMLNKLIDTIGCMFPCADDCEPEQEKCRECVIKWLSDEIELGKAD